MTSTSADRYFLDTNVLVYANDPSDAARQPVATRLVSDGIRTRRGVVSSQVLGEFWVTVTRKVRTPLSPEAAEARLTRLGSLLVVPVGYDTVVLALHLLRRYRLSYWDSLIVSAARSSGCEVLYSEDLNHEQRYDEVLVLNPFV